MSQFHSKRAVQLDSFDAEVWLSRGEVLCRTGDELGAWEAIRRVKTLSPDSAAQAQCEQLELLLGKRTSNRGRAGNRPEREIE